MARRRAGVLPLTWRPELDFALHLADVADAISMSHFRRRPRERLKADGTIVTEADEAVEAALRAEVRAAYPGHAVLGEEQGSAGEVRGGDPAFRWILDPIDGTKNYSWGIPVWASLIALEARGEVVVGVVSAPALGERYDAARGAGARRNGDAIAVSDVGEVDEARLGYATFAAFERHGFGDGFLTLARRVRASRGFGDFWGHMLVAAGSLDVMVEPVVNVWDLAALMVVVEEAGGMLTDLRGERRIDGGTCLTTNGRLHDDVLRLFAR